MTLIFFFGGGGGGEEVRWKTVRTYGKILATPLLGLENAALGLRPREAFSRPRSQFFTIRTSQPANNIYMYQCYIALVRYLLQQRLLMKNAPNKLALHF